jgi:hypothetical protein
MPIIRGIAPIFGDQVCVYLSEEAHIRYSSEPYGALLQPGLSILFDIQPEGSTPSVLLGGGTSDRSALVITMNDGGVKKNRLRVDIRDDDGKHLSAAAQCSPYSAN